MKINVVLAPFPVSPSVQANLAQMEALLDAAQPQDWVIFPEGAVSGYSTDITFLQNVDPREVEAGLACLRAAAALRRLTLWAGACIYASGAWYNTAQGMDAAGHGWEYRKINLANHERGVFASGGELPVYEIPASDGVVMTGVQLCRELRYPEQWGWLARQGAQVILHLNNAVGTDTCQPVWRSHLISRAAETQRFVISVNNAAARQVCPTLAVAPDGQVLAEWVSAEARPLRLELDLSQVSNWNLDQCRSDVVRLAPGRAA